MKLTSFLASTSLLAIALTACGGGEDLPEYDARFDGATTAQMQRVFTASAGYDGAIALLLASAYSSAEDADCPRVEREGSTVTVTGGCDTDDGRIEGTLIAENVPSFFLEEDPNFDPDKPQRATFQDFTLDGDEDDIVLDGEIEFDASAGRYAIDLVLQLDGVTSEIDAVYLSPEDNGEVTIEADSWAYVDGVGTFAIAGEYRLEDPGAGSLTASGADGEVTFDLAAQVDGCIPYDGVTSGEICESDPE